MKKYYIYLNGEQVGPLSYEELQQKGITPETYVWYEGMATWQQARELDELSLLFPHGNTPFSNTVSSIPPMPESNFGTHTNYNTGYSQSRAEFNDAPPIVPPKNYLVWAILVTIFCCLPFGIVSIVYAAQVDRQFNLKDYRRAEQYSKNARTWAIVSAVCGCFASFIYLIAYFVCGVALFSGAYASGF